MKESITIVTAFFDIGRGDWNRANGRSRSLERTNNTYLKYFRRLAKLENKMVIFTSSEFKEKILALRKDKPTHIITIDLQKKFKFILKKIAKIQNSDSFKSLIQPKLLRCPEYWSPEYVLINNIKSFFVKKAIDANLVDSDLVAWVDFGYIRNNSTLYGITEWNHPFDKNKVHFFTIKNTLDLTDEKAVLETVLNNDPHIIGSVFVASKEKWPEFYKLIFKTQKDFLASGMIDDDQGIYITCVSKNPDFFQLNYLGHMNWVNVFKLFHDGSKSNNLIRLGIKLKIIK
ncbi:protein YibB [Providencia stuartii]|nr:protein YibB [Providencia stuartii]SST05067.1 protein YibB [Acinetobacter baumannii]AMG67631.1 protein YibB [Providencia stuartii]MCX3070510.1 protein YibB [Providencia stuartii]MDT2016581.1 protein YibB [Providencia stuartii]MDT2082173.1 protein YibB [Providencia stuartii]